MQPTLCSVAKRMASEHFGIRLDLTARSVRQVEKILGAIHKEHVRSRADAAFDGIALEYAAYIVEVIQGQFGPARWERDCPRRGADTFPLHWRGQTLYPYAWCQKRIYDGAADDVWSRFKDAVLGKTARRWWQPFGRRASDPAPESVRRPPDAPGVAGTPVERRARRPDEDRRQLPARPDVPPPRRDHATDSRAGRADSREARARRDGRHAGGAAAPPDEKSRGAVIAGEPVAMEAPQVLEVLEPPGERELALARAPVVDAEQLLDPVASAPGDACAPRAVERGEWPREPDPPPAAEPAHHVPSAGR